ncbi:MAG: hypothetical protein COY38_03410 [Candidatus Aenigmarchaeota archaeon CG_4_10_14_0_8_um_filter_37_24]
MQYKPSLDIVGTLGGKGSRAAVYTGFDGGDNVGISKANLPIDISRPQLRPVEASQLPPYDERFLEKDLPPYIIPLVALQLWKISEGFDIRRVLVSMNQKWHLDLFEKYVKRGSLPEAEYFYGIHTYEDPTKTFERIDDDTLSRFGEQPFLWTTGDLHFSEAHVSNMLDCYRRLSRGGEVLVGTRISRFDGMVGICFRQQADGRIVGCYENGDAEFAIKFPFIVPPSLIPAIRDFSRREQPRLERLIRQMANERGVAVVEPEGEFYNLNTALEIERFCGLTGLEDTRQRIIENMAIFREIS